MAGGLIAPEEPGRMVVWFSCGAASAVAAKLVEPDVIAYCETGSEGADNARFLLDCEQWFGRSVTKLRGKDTPGMYFGTWRVRRPTRTRMVLIWDKGGALGMGALDLPWKPDHEAQPMPAREQQVLL